MMICLENVLSDAQVDGFRRVLDDGTLFESGQRTAGGAARRAKDNLQATAARPEVRRLLDTARERLNAHPEFQRFALPEHIGRLLLSRYDEGMGYGTHFDAAVIDGRRTDLSVTLFLSDPEHYEGGELEITSPMGTQAVRLPAGCALVYPGDQLHAVRPVTRGTRLALVGWVQSQVREADRRAVLYTLADALSALPDNEQTGAALLQLKLVRNNLLRLWHA